MIYISKKLKDWVKADPEAMNEAYNECWRQKEVIEKQLKELKENRYKQGVRLSECANEGFHKIRIIKRKMLKYKKYSTGYKMYLDELMKEIGE
ncbi:hypothetical protein N9924_01150 [bacterium]|nr:hypothetical protein [bacterium]